MSSISIQVPLDIWANIFVQCLPSQRYVQPSSSHAPMLLCQVNRAWRSTALSLPKLWSSISVEVVENREIEKKVEGIGTWLGRSGVRPLAISFHLCDDEMNRDPVWDLIISFIGRWEDVQLEFGRPLCDSIQNIHLLRAPLLKRFVGGFGIETGDMMPQLFSMLRASPHLTDFVWYDNGDRDPYQFRFAEFTLPWSQFTRFKTDFILDVNECFKVLRLCPSLIDCTVEYFTSPTRIPISLPDVPIVHQHLRALSFGCERIDQFLDHLTLPSLSALAFEWKATHSISIWPYDSLVAFLARSSCSLKTFRVHTAVIPSDQLIELLFHLPTLTELSIEGDKFDALGDTLFHGLTYDETVGGLRLCPTLQVITLAGFFTPSSGMLAKMLESRYCSDLFPSQIACLRRVTVRLGKMLSAYSKELEAIRDMGLEVDAEPVDNRFMDVDT